MPLTQLSCNAIGEPMSLPDITVSVPSTIHATIDKVGMKHIELPLMITIGNQSTQILADVDAFVSLDSPQAKGIHMSRLYLELQNQLSCSPLSIAKIFETLSAMKDSQNGLSSSSYLDISFQLPLERPALLSDNHGYRFYPIRFSAAHSKSGNQLSVSIGIQYSSTCPCSAALARQINQKQFLADFAQESIRKEDVFNWLGTQKSVAATPHSQRSLAQIDLSLSPGTQIENLITVINHVEAGLKTAVQTAVKREDEQEFARLNAQNLMFCEDAVKQIKTDLEALDFVLDYRVESQHLESLHAHDATAILCKGIPNGFKA